MGANIGTALLGAEGLVFVEARVPSSSNPGLLSVVSEPLDLHIDFTRLWLGVIKWMKSGRETPDKSKMLMTLRDFFMIGQRAPRFAFPACPERVKSLPGGEIEVAVLQWPIRAMRTIRTEVASSGFVIGREYMTFHEDPLRLEAWGEIPGTRFAGEWLRGTIQGVLDIIVKRAKPDEKSDIRVHANVEDPPDSGIMSVVTTPLDKYLTLDRLWIEWLDLLKYVPKEGPIKSSKLIVHTESDFSVTQVYAGSAARAVGLGEPRAEDVVETKRVYANSETKTIHIESHVQDGTETPRRVWVRFVEKPFLIQAWGENPGKRYAEEVFAKYMERMLNSVIAADGQSSRD